MENKQDPVVHTYTTLRLIFEDLKKRGLCFADIAQLLADSGISANDFNIEFPSDNHLIELFKNGYNTYPDGSSLFTLESTKIPNVISKSNVECMVEEDDGDGRECRVVWKYTTLDNKPTYIKYSGTYSSWDSNVWDYISVANPRKVTLLIYESVDYVYI